MKESATVSAPYRLEPRDTLELALGVAQREITLLRAAKRRSRAGTVVSLSLATAGVAAFCGALLWHSASLARAAAPDAVAVPDAPPDEGQEPEDPSQQIAQAAAAAAFGDGPGIAEFAKEVATGLAAEPTLRKSARFRGFGVSRLQDYVRRRLASDLNVGEASADDSEVVQFSLGLTEVELAAASAEVERCLDARGVAPEHRGYARDLLSDRVDRDQIQALLARAALGLRCDEGRLQLRRLESPRIVQVTGCGTSAIYASTTGGDGVDVWHRESAH